MTGPAVGEDQRALLVDSLRAAERACAKAQARRAQLMVQLAEARKSADQRRCHELEIEGASPRYKPGEFAAMEIALALTASTPTVQQQIARARRLQAEAPDAWDAWIAGDINEAKAHQISHALRKLERADSKRMLNLVVVAAARPLTDPAGQLLDVAELGPFPSATLAAAIRFRDPVCTNPICHTAAARCDVDHVIPWPQGPTAAPNLAPARRHDHRAKTHAGFGAARTGDQADWITPTGHRYTNPADPLPVEPWPTDVAGTG